MIIIRSNLSQNMTRLTGIGLDAHAALMAFCEIPYALVDVYQSRVSF